MLPPMTSRVRTSMRATRWSSLKVCARDVGREFRGNAHGFAGGVLLTGTVDKKSVSSLCAGGVVDACAMGCTGGQCRRRACARTLQRCGRRGSCFDILRVHITNRPAQAARDMLNHTQRMVNYWLLQVCARVLCTRALHDRAWLSWQRGFSIGIADTEADPATMETISRVSGAEEKIVV